MIIHQLLLGVIIGIVFIVMIVPVNKIDINKYDEYFSQSNLNYIRGIACVIVVLSHISIQLGGEGVLIASSNLGPMAVGVFFLCSGYGLMHSKMIKDHYMDRFLLKRLPKVLIPFWIVNIIFLIEQSLLFGEIFSIDEIIQYTLGIKLICGHAWYIQCLVILYLVFYITNKFIQDNRLFSIVLFFEVVGLKILFFIAGNKLFGEILPFGIGILLACIPKDKIKDLAAKYYKLFFCVLFFLYMITYLYMSIIKWHISSFFMNSFLIDDIMLTLCQNSFVLLVIWIMMKYQVRSRASKFIGGISYEVYLLHQIAIDCVITWLGIEEKTLCLFISLVGAIFLGGIFYMFKKKVIQLVVERKTRRFS